MKMWFDVDTYTIVTENDLWSDFLEWIDADQMSRYPYHKYHFQYEIEDYLAVADDRYLVPITNADRFTVKEGGNYDSK